MPLPISKSESVQPGVSKLLRGSRAARRSSDERDRVTVDLRGLRPRLHAQAEQRQPTAAALVRRAVVAMLDDESGGGVEDELPDRLGLAQVVKVTVRLSAGHAYLLASRARKADVSQGAYVASLIDGTPAAPKAPDHARAVAALVTSSDRLAVMSVDLNAFMRMVGRVPSTELEQYRHSVHSLREYVRKRPQLRATLQIAS